MALTKTMPQRRRAMSEGTAESQTIRNAAWIEFYRNSLFSVGSPGPGSVLPPAAPPGNPLQSQCGYIDISILINTALVIILIRCQKVQCVGMSLGFVSACPSKMGRTWCLFDSWPTRMAFILLVQTLERSCCSGLSIRRCSSRPQEGGLPCTLSKCFCCC